MQSTGCPSQATIQACKAARAGPVHHAVSLQGLGTRRRRLRATKPQAQMGDTSDLRTRKVHFSNKEGHRLVGIFTEASSPNHQAVILCHGYSSTKDSMQLPKLAAALSQQGLNSLRFDFRGNGESSGTFRLGNYNEEVEDIHSAKQYLEAEEGQQVVGLVGHSKGGNDVLLYASKYDDIPAVVNMAGRLYMDQGIAQRFGEGIFQEVKQGPKSMRATRSDGFEFLWELTEEDLECRLAIDMPAAAASIKKSNVLTVHGSGDAVIPVEDGQRFAELIPGSELVVIEGADHNFRNEPSYAAELVGVVVKYLVKQTRGL